MKGSGDLDGDCVWGWGCLCVHIDGLTKARMWLALVAVTGLVNNIFSSIPVAMRLAQLASRGPIQLLQFASYKGTFVVVSGKCIVIVHSLLDTHVSQMGWLVRDVDRLVLALLQGTGAAFGLVRQLDSARLQP